MEITALLSRLPSWEANGPAHGTVTGLAYNTMTMKAGDLFFCLRGKKMDGHNFADDALRRGAAAFVVEEFLPLDILQIKVPDSRTALSVIGRLFYGDPDEKLGLVGVTGTNGKTTTAFYIRAVLQRLHRPIGIIGTVYNQLGGPPEPSTITTPESADLWRLFARAVADDCQWVVLEASSHALALHRVDARILDVGVFLNITRDHFDYHATFEHYFATKATIVRGLLPERKGDRPKAAVLNADDPRVMEAANGCAVPIVTFGLEHSADVMAFNLQPGIEGTRFTLQIPGATAAEVYLPMPGLYNVSNALAAAAVGWLAGVSLSGIVQGVQACRAVPGRAEPIREGQPFRVIVDYAHNPDALSKIVSLRPDTPTGRSILVFGAEGGKDRGKRPQMGAAARGADYVIVTTDNMFQEEPHDVVAQVLAGLAGYPHEVVIDRREAIARAFAIARPGDLVIIAGKGHEQAHVVGGRPIPWDDRKVARELLHTAAIG